MDSKGWLSTAWYAFLLVALLASPLWSVFASWRRRTQRAGDSVVEARVLASRLEAQSGRLGYRPCWEVEYEHEGRRHQAHCLEADDRFVTGSTGSRKSIVQEAAQRRLDRHAVGDIVSVRLQAGRPQEVRLAREPLDTQALVLVLGMLAVVGIAFGLLYVLS